MGLMTTSLKWGTKIGLAGGSVYLASHQGLFGTAEQATQGVATLKTSVTDAIPQYVPQEIIDGVPALPSTPSLSEMIPFEVSHDARGYWNKGVIASFGAVANAPNALGGYSKDLVNYVSDQVAAASIHNEPAATKEESSKKKDESCEDCSSKESK
jgi:hypothetical protein